MSVIKLENVDIKFKRRPLLHNVNFAINTGELVQLIGPNGSGKSTILRVVSGLLEPVSGKVYINDQELLAGKYAENTAVMINTPSFIPTLTGLENLKLLASIKDKIDVGQIETWMKKFGLNPTDKTKVRGYSVGMNQKLGLTQAFMEEDQIILLDEPMNGLDKQSKQKVIEIVKQVREVRPNTTMIVVSHDDSFKDIADRFLVIDGENVVESRTYDEATV